MTKSEFLLLVTIVCAVLLIGVLCGIIFTCAGAEKQTLQIDETIIEEPHEPEDIEDEDEEYTESEQTANTGVRVSHQTSRVSSLSDINRIRGRVNVSEIDPVNFNNPDIDVLRQMGADPYLISFFTGEQFYRNADYDRAIAEYTASINRNGEFSASYVSRGNAWMRKREYSRAIDDYSRAIRLDGSRAELYNYRGFARTELASSRNHSELNLAIEDFSRALVLNRNYIDALVNRSHVYYQIGNYDKTIEDCDQIIRLEPGNAVIWNRRGSAWYRKENDERAISDFTEAIRLNANYAIAWYNRGNAYYNRREYDKALADLNRCLAINSSFAAAYISRGNILSLLGNTESAAADYAAAQRLQSR